MGQNTYNNSAVRLYQFSTPLVPAYAAAKQKLLFQIPPTDLLKPAFVRSYTFVLPSSNARFCLQKHISFRTDVIHLHDPNNASGKCLRSRGEVSTYDEMAVSSKFA